MGEEGLGELVGRLWSAGEELSSCGDHAGALLQFQRAKTLLLTESKSLVGQQGVGTSSSASKVLGQIMQKLSVSIDRDVATLGKNPVHALGLNRGFNKADVKKAYRKSALKYHPDKNIDCDTSCIFAAIQSSYEKLNAALDDSSSAPGAAAAGPAPRSSAGPAYSSSYYSSSSSSSSSSSTTYTHVPGARNQPSRPSPYEFKSFQEREYARQQAKANLQKKQEHKAKEQRERAAAAAAAAASEAEADDDADEPIFHPSYNQRHEKRSFRQEASYLSEMPTSGLKKMLRQFGFGELVELMSREELIKKYLAVSSHLDAKKGAGAGGSKPSAARGRRPSEFRSTDVGDDSEDPALFEDILQAESAAAAASAAAASAGPSARRKSSSGLEGDYEELAQRWASEWASEMRAELDREQNRHRASSKQREQMQRQQQPHFQQRHAPKPAPAHAPAPAVDPAELRRRETADALRQERSSWLAQQLPHMALPELRRLLLSAGLGAAGMDEMEDRDALLGRLCLHFGIKKEEVLASARCQGAEGAERSGQQKARAKRERGGASFTPAEAAMNAKIHLGGGGKMDSKMDLESIKKVVSSIGQRVAPAAKPLPPMPARPSVPAPLPNPASIVTKERLQEMERRLMGEYRRPARAPSSATAPGPPAAGQDKAPPPTQAPASRSRLPPTNNQEPPDDDDDDGSIDSDADLDLAERTRMERWKISELYIPEPEPDAGAADDGGDIRIAQSMLDSDDGDEDDEDEDVDQEEGESRLDGRAEIQSKEDREERKGEAGPRSSEKKASPLSSRAWAPEATPKEPTISSRSPVPRLPDLSALQSQAQALLAAGLDAQQSSGLAEGGRLAGRLRAVRSSGAGLGEAAAQGVAVQAGAQRSPEQAAELQEEVDFWVHSPRGVTYQDMRDLSERGGSAKGDRGVASVPSAPGPKGGDGFIFFG